MLTPHQEQIIFGIWAEMEQTNRMLQQVIDALTPLRKPLLCRLGIHLPHSLMVGVNREACHRCGYSWEEHWSVRLGPCQRDGHTK